MMKTLMIVVVCCLTATASSMLPAQMLPAQTESSYSAYGNPPAASGASIVSSGGSAPSSLSDPTGRADSSKPSALVTSGGFPMLSPRILKANDSTAETADQPSGVRERLGASSISSMVTVVSSLAIVLALFCGLVVVSRKFGNGRGAGKPLPASVIRPIGHTMLDPRTKLLLIQCGRRVLIASQTTHGLTPLSEVTDPDEIGELVAACSGESRQAFQNTIRQIEREPVHGFTESATTPARRPSDRPADRPADRNAKRPSPSKLFASA